MASKVITKDIKKLCSGISNSFNPTSREIVVFIDMDTYILTEGRNFKTFLKENESVALDSCYFFIEHGIENDADSTYWVCIH